jgi:hypothetical protein
VASTSLWLNVWADLQHQLDEGGQRMPHRGQRRDGLTIVTGNDRHFRRPGLKIFNPFKELPEV